MSQDTRMREPGPAHPITITPHEGVVRVLLGGEVIAESRRALKLQEAAMAPVFYIPREDARMAAMQRTPLSTFCPYKGDASYYTITAGAKRAENTVWSYEAPYPAMADIAGHLAFYPTRVDAIEMA